MKELFLGLTRLITCVSILLGTFAVPAVAEASSSARLRVKAKCEYAQADLKIKGKSAVASASINGQDTRHLEVAWESEDEISFEAHVVFQNGETWSDTKTAERPNRCNDSDDNPPQPVPTGTPTSLPTEGPTQAQPTNTPTATETPGNDPATPAPTQPETKASCQIQLVQALDNGWVEIKITYQGGQDETAWWYFESSGASIRWTDEWFGVSGETSTFGVLFTPGESFDVNVYLNGTGPLCSKGISVPTPATQEAPPTDAAPTGTPEEIVSCNLSTIANDENYVTATISYVSGPQGDGIWWVLFYHAADGVQTEWAGSDKWETGQDGSRTITFQKTFAPGEYDFRVDVLEHKDNACSGHLSVPAPNDPEDPSETPNPEPEDDLQSPDVQLGDTFLGTTSPNGWYQVFTREGALWMRNGRGLEYPVGIEGENPLYLPDWTILAQHEGGAFFLTDRLGTFTRELGVSGKLLDVSVNNQWVKISNDGHPTIVSIHGAGYGVGPADAAVFSHIVFPSGP